MNIVRYEPGYKSLWDETVSKSKNATFLLYRDYMDYHADRFIDNSFLFFDDDGKVISLLPATLHGDELRSHGGLTYGGFVLNDHTSAAGKYSPEEMLKPLIEHLADNGIRQLIYKPIPHIYHKRPSEEDLYALFKCKAQLTIRNLASVIDLKMPISSSRLGKRALKRARQSELEMEQVTDISLFWQIIVDDRRTRHNTLPVHSEHEMQMLRDRFPDNILFYVVRKDSKVIAGAVVYRTNGVLHLQYAAADDEGKQLYAVDLIYHCLVYDLFPQDKYFDFGTSNENNGLYLNEGMVRHKEEFGARSIVYDTYSICCAKA